MNRPPKAMNNEVFTLNIFTANSNISKLEAKYLFEWLNGKSYQIIDQ